VAHAKALRHPEIAEATVSSLFEAERAHLVPYSGRFDGFHVAQASAWKTCLVRIGVPSATARAGGRHRKSAH
jgi:hypothetical protein